MSDKTLGAYERHETPDDMDGGVTAALIEKEAQGTVGALIAELERHRARAEKAERERDEAVYQRDQWMRGSDSWRATLDEAIEERRRIARALDLPENVTADAMATRIEEVESLLLTPDAITDEMVERGLAAWKDEVGRTASNYGGARFMALTAALTEPQRPVGAEVVQNYLEGFLSGVRFLHDIDPAWLADCLIEALNINGVCVVTEDGGGGETPDVCPHIGGPGGDCGCPL